MTGETLAIVAPLWDRLSSWVSELSGAPSVLPQCEGNLAFPDAYVDQLVHDAVDTAGPITSADVANLTTLLIPFNDADVDITGVECLSALMTLRLDRGGQTGLEVLADLPNLRTVTFTDPYSVDLTALSQVTQITSLDLHGLAEGDFGALANLTNLENLNLSGVGLFGQVPVDITPVGTLAKLTSLDLSGVVILNGAPLSSLTQLESLSLSGATIASVSPVTGLSQLRLLRLANTKITAIPNLTALTKLTTLDLSYNALSDFTPLSAHTTLTNLRLASTTLGSLTSIAPLTALVSLDVSYNALTDVTTLGALPALTSLNVSYNPSVTSVHPLATSSYIGAGDDLDLTNVGDCGTGFMTDLQAIKDKNVTLTDGCGI